MLVNNNKVHDTSKIWKSISWVSPSRFITSDRFDLIAKILYLKNIDNTFYRDLYLKSIYSLNGFKEDNGEEKSKAQDFLNSFTKTYESINKSWFLSDTSLIPISKKTKILLDWAHRLSSCYVLNRNVDVVEVDEDATVYNYNYFASKWFDWVLLDYCLQEYINNMSDNVFSGILWWKSKWKLTEVKSIIEKYNGVNICTKEIVLTEKGKHNIIVSCYKDEKWLWNISNNYIWAQKKIDMCFGPKDNTIRVIFFEFHYAISENQLIKLKEEIRDIFKIEKNSIHITDNKAETRELSNIFLNKNSIHYINNMNFKDYRTFFRLFDEYAIQINWKKSSYCLTWSWVLSLYGIREGNDIDFITMDKQDNRENHNLYVTKFLNTGLVDLIYSPNSYFVLQNWLKVLSIENIRKFKQLRGEWKDIIDVQLIDGFLSWNINLLSSVKISYFESKRFILYWTLNILIRIWSKIIPKKYLPFFKKIYYKIIWSL